MKCYFPGNSRENGKNLCEKRAVIDFLFSSENWNYALNLTL